VESQKKGLTSILGHYKFLISIRHATEALLNGTIYSYPSPSGLLAYLRNDLLIVHNLTNKELFLPFLQDFQFFMQLPTHVKLPDNGKIAPYSTMIFKHK
jgi:hypothetical protein